MGNKEWGLYINDVCEITGGFMYLQKIKWDMEKHGANAGKVIEVRKVTRHSERVERDDWEVD